MKTCVCVSEVVGGAQVEGCYRYSSLALLIPRLHEEQYLFHYTSDIFWFDHTDRMFFFSFPERHFVPLFFFPSPRHVSGRCGKSLSLRASIPDTCKHNHLWWTMCLENSRWEQTKALSHTGSLYLFLHNYPAAEDSYLACLLSQPVSEHMPLISRKLHIAFYWHLYECYLEPLHAQYLEGLKKAKWLSKKLKYSAFSGCMDRNMWIQFLCNILSIEMPPFGQFLKES